jgi:asparagine synthase (glutamine-hydrolysing)
LKGYDPVDELREQLPDRFFAWDPLCQAQYLESAYLLPAYLLSSQGERMGMANSVEGRFPYLDHRVVDFATKIPPRSKLRFLKEKHVLREGAKDLLPGEVLRRFKQPYRSPDHSAFFPQGRPHSFVREALSRMMVTKAAFFSAQAVEALTAKAQQQRTLGTADGMALTGVLSVQLLFNQFVVNCGAKPPQRFSPDVL